jgi:hypothetical protein
MTRLTLVACLAAAALLLASCGDDDDGSEPTTQQANPPATATQDVGGAPVGASARECNPQRPAFSDLRATGLGCTAARTVVFAWARSGPCRPSGSRSACSVQGFRCLSTRAGGAVAVDCSRPGRSLSFTARPTPK